MKKMWNKLTTKQKQLIPDLYSQEGVKDPKVYAKFFIGGWTWYVTEFDKKDTMFGYVISPQLQGRGEFGYISYNELLSINIRGIEVDRDLHQVNPRQPKLLSKMLKEDRAER